MNEQFLHYIWKLRKFDLNGVYHATNGRIRVISVGVHNHDAGPDFFNAKIEIDGQLWAGNVEIHVNASDWYVHGHEKDHNYQNVILHVVWEDDVVVYSYDGRIIPVLVMKPLIGFVTLSNYEKLIKTQKQFINCETRIHEIDHFLWGRWLERLFFTRLQSKSAFIEGCLQQNGNDWEATLFRVLMRNFGFAINADSFESVATAVNHRVIRKMQNDYTAFESFLFGMTGLLEGEYSDSYFRDLKKLFRFQQRKYGLSSGAVIAPKFHRLRPLNFPTIRLSQIAHLYSKEVHLFSKIMDSNTKEAFYELFDVVAGPYWDTHYTFDKPSPKKSKKRTSKAFIDLIIINTVIPLKFKYAQYAGASFDEDLIGLMEALLPEKNSIIVKFTQLGVKVPNAFRSQSLLQLYTEYCRKNKCLQCEVGNKLINE
ncbi:Protein of unknown function [Zhouia amylolytica]|uniref:DUF2851 domain-containing protein n=1 Tax=Zhouia amylolytica TaxID=376730 RepID=A0A1I6TRK3_9FLAO|nr:DUF2851 family protein [Zhouia amylolytica]SFS91728.1 Protein of unknown function [Zhouia amylolytica]